MTLRVFYANRRYSSWSMRVGLLLAESEVSYRSTTLAFSARNASLECSPSDAIPCLVENGRHIVGWMQIMDFIHQRSARFPVWPRYTSIRTHAQRLCAEFVESSDHLRHELPFVLDDEFKGRVLLSGSSEAQLKRCLVAIEGTLATHSCPCLYEEFSGVDCFFAPFLFRLRRYKIDVSPRVNEYMSQILGRLSVLEWVRGAAIEGSRLAALEERIARVGTTNGRTAIFEGNSLGQATS
jgi:glutathione S-transferase